MTISLKSKAAGNPNLDAVFDPYVQGTPVPATGLLADASLGGGDIANRYAPLVYGSPAAATGLLTKQAGHADLNTLFAAFGTAVYALPINGNTYTGAYNIPVGGTGYTTIGFSSTPSGYQVYYANPATSKTVLASGTFPANTAKVKYVFGTYSIPVGSVDALGATTNGASSPTAISSNPAAYYTTNTWSATSGSRARSYPFQIVLYDASNNVISTTNITLIGETEGSV